MRPRDRVCRPSPEALDGVGHFPFVEAAAQFGKGMLLAQEVGAAFTIYWCLVGFGALERTRQRAVPAARLFGAAEAFLQARSIRLSGPNKAELDSEVSAARALLDEAAWDKAWAEGYAVPPEKAVAFALQHEAVSAIGTTPSRR